MILFTDRSNKRNGRVLRKPTLLSKAFIRSIALIISLCITANLALCGAASAQGETTLLVQVKGVFYDVSGGWRSVTLSAPVDVFTADGAYIGSVSAGANGDTLVLNSVDEVILRAGEGASIDGFVFADDTAIAVNNGQANIATLFAYAEQGLFTARNILAETGEPLAGAEYAVLNDLGEVLHSFTFDESGVYRSDRLLPVGDYSLVQMRAADGTVAMPPIPFTVGVYFGNDTDISDITAESQSVPKLDASVGRLRMTADSLVIDNSGERALGRVTIDGVCDGGNSYPLNDVTLSVNIDALIDAQGSPVSGGDVSLYEIRLDGGSQAIASALDASGAELARGLSLADGLAAALPDGTRTVVLEYMHDGQSVLPQGYNAGSAVVGLSYIPDAAVEPTAVVASATCNMRYRCPNPDGVSFTEAGHLVAPVSARVGMPDGRRRPAISAKVNGSDIEFTASPNEALQNDTSIIIELPHGARVNEYYVDCDLFLRMKDNDAVVIPWARMLAGYTLPVRFGTVESVSVYAPDPLGLEATDVNPHGAALIAESYGRNALWDTLLGRSGGVYALLSCPLEGAVQLEAIDEYTFVAASGSLMSTGGGVPSAAIVLRSKEGNLCYGNAIKDDGTFEVYMPQPNQHTLNQPLDLCCMLPDGASETSTGAQGLYTVGITMPATDLHITYSRRSSLSGSVRDEAGVGLQGVELSLVRDGEAVAAQTTDAFGEYRFDNLIEGSYMLTARSGGLASFIGGEGFALSENGREATTSALALSGEQEIKLSLTARRECELKGVALLDASPVAGIELELTREDGTSLRRVTGEDGAYLFEAPDTGEWTLTLSPPEGCILISVGSQTLNLRERATLPLTLEAGVLQTQDVVFGRTASILGGSELLGAGKRAVAAYLGGSVSAETDAAGNFRFDSLTPGDYSIYVALPDGMTLASGSEWRLTAQGDMCWVTVSPTSGEELQLPALSYTTYTGVEGYAFHDVNSDGVRTDDEPLLTGVPVTLQRATDDGWTDFAQTKTDEYGRYCFEQLTVGDYRVASDASSSGLYVASIGSDTQTDGGRTVYSGLISLRDGERSTDYANIGLRQAASLTFTAFKDDNLNGARGAGERGVSGVLVELISRGEVVASGETDSKGELILATIQPGEYSLRVTPPRGYAPGVRGVDSLVGDTTEPTAESEPISLQGGQAAAYGAGLSAVGSFSGKVFEDVNDNGIMDEDEPGVAGVTLILRSSRGGNEYRLVTDETGQYAFNNLPNDSYTFTAELPEGMLLARYSKDGGDLRSVFTGETTARQYTISNSQHLGNKNVGVIERGSVDGIVFLDLNYNGFYDEGEPGFAGVTMELIRVYNAESKGRVVTGDDGAYRFDSLRSGDYRLRAILPTGGSVFTVVAEGDNANLFAHRDGRRENSIQPVAVGSGMVTHTLVGVAVGASIEGFVFQDEDYNGVHNGREKTFSGMRVRLLNEQGAEVASTVTGAGGTYTLSGIMPGTYVVEVARKPGYGFTRVRPNESNGNRIIELEGEYGFTAPITVAMGDTVSNINAGMLPSSTVTGILFDDLNDNGLRDEGEGGMTSASVRLVSADGEINLTRGVSESGEYFFDGVMPGSYTLTFLLPEHTELAKVAQGGNTLENRGRETTSPAFNVAMGESCVYPLVGAVTLGSFEGFVFHDINANGVADENEERIPAVELTLTPARKDLSAQSATTDSDGSYSIRNLRPSEYSLEIELPNGYILSHDLSEEGIGFEAVTRQSVECPWQSLINRAVKQIGAVKPASVSGAIWLDENKDASYGGEALLSGVSVELVSRLTGMVAKRTTSDEQGFRFDAVRPGQYRIRFALPEQSEPAGETDASFTLSGVYMVCEGVEVAEAQTLENLNVGLVSRTSIGGKAWLDAGGSTIPVPDLPISLYIDGQDGALQTTVTAEDGSYRFDGLWPGAYRIEAAKPDGMVFVRPDDANYPSGASVIVHAEGASGSSDALALQMARHQSGCDIMYIKPAKVGDQAWVDLNRNGLIDGGEPMLYGVTVRLVHDGGVQYETVTDANGYYLFADVYPGVYTLTAVAYPQLGITKAVPELRMISSCLVSGDGSSAASDPFEVVSGSSNVDFNLGYILTDGASLPDMPKPETRDWTGANSEEQNRGY